MWIYNEANMTRQSRNRAAGRASGRLAGAILVVLAAGLLAIPGTVYGQAKVGTTGAQFLELGVSARAMGMAEAFTAVTDDISAVYYNPSALVFMYGREASFTYVSMPADVNFYFGAVGLPLEAVGGVLGVAAYTLTSGDMIERTYNQGTYEGTGRVFSYDDFALAVSYGRYLTDRFSIGLSVKYIGEFTHDYSASGWAADIGTTYDTGFRGFKIGMMISNFGPDMRMITNDYPLPINFRFGGSINLVETADLEHRVLFSAEGWHPSDNLEKYNAGVEYTFRQRFSLRAGSRFQYDVGEYTFGGGLRVPFGDENEIRVDYAYQDFGVLTEVHRFTMSIAF